MPSLGGRPTGAEYWRSLDELADAPEFRSFLEAEFPHLAPALQTSPTRRQFLKVMGASLALAGMTGCRWPRETIVPYSNRPDGRTPGVPASYATAMDLCGVATGLLVTSYDGRPIKIEGNALHPLSRGASGALAQASVLDLYDPDRSRCPAARGAAGLTDGSWDKFATEASARFAPMRTNGGAGLRVLSEASSSPSLAAMRTRFLASFPKAEWLEYEPVSRDNERLGTAQAFGAPHRSHLNLRNAEVVVSFDDDFLLSHPASVPYTRDFASRRTAADGTMNRLYVLESTLSLTGSNADHRYAERSSDIPTRLVQLAAVLAKQGLEIGALGEATAEGAPGYLEALARDLLEHRGRGVITVGPRQPAWAHALAAALNAALGNAGKTVSYTAEPDSERLSHADSIRRLTESVKGGKGGAVVIVGGNPVYNAPADVDFARALAGTFSVHLSLHRDETSRACNWHLPQAHYLESWSDARAWDGTLSIVQPLIAPLFDGKTPAELIAWICGDPLTTAYDITRRTFGEQFASGDFEAAWRKALNDGLVDGTNWVGTAPAISSDAVATSLDAIAGSASKPSGDFEVVFAQDNTLFDGRFANNGWLQELPDPLTKLTWDNAALISPADATRLGLKREDVVTIALNGRELEVPVYTLPGHAPGSITLPLGYGRSAGGRVAAGSGFNAYSIRTSLSPFVATGAKVTPKGGSYRLATTQDHHAIASDVGEHETQVRIPEIVREGTLAEYREHPDFAKHRVHTLPLTQPFGEHEFEGKPRWAMAIDLAKCTGCSACSVACQAENNVPVVGKSEVLMGREMAWIRIDRYFKGDPEDASGISVAHQPLACQHCENAPCEQVCPVGATMHDEEGLNVMVYNRCIGTRYCSNNCPYKVRRFNWFYNHHGPAHPFSGGKLDRTDLTDVEKMVFNPEVTMRSRGVMEKCTFCVQRIAAVKIEAGNENRPIRDGEITPACAQACPAEAIVFGDLNDSNSRVSKAHADSRGYALLDFLNVRPRNVYLAGLKNPADDSGAEHGSHGSHAG